MRSAHAHAKLSPPLLALLLGLFVASVLAGCGGGVDRDHDGALDSDEKALGLDLHASRVIYVAPGGDDHAAGTWQHPRRSLQTALNGAPGGAAILVLPGDYPSVQVTRIFPSTVGVYGIARDGRRPRVAGVEIWGARGLAIHSLDLTATSQVTSHPTLKARQPAGDIVFAGNDMSSPGHVCLRIRSGSTRISVVGNHIHDCSTGIGGPGTPEVSRGIVIRRNLLERFSADGIQFGAWDDVSITDNVVQDVRDPAGLVHNDAIQFTGASANVVVARNLLRDSSQLLFVQPAIGRIEGVTASDNLMYNARAYAVQIQGTPGVRFTHNTVWASHYGAVLLREGAGKDGSVVPDDAVVSDNVLEGFGVTGGAAPRSFDRNLLGSAASVEGSDNVVQAPRFRDPPSGDYRLDGSPLAGVGVDFSSVRWDPARPNAVLATVAAR